MVVDFMVTRVGQGRKYLFLKILILNIVKLKIDKKYTLIILFVFVLAGFLLPIVKVTKVSYEADESHRAQSWAYGIWKEKFLNKKTSSPFELFIVAEMGNIINVKVSRDDGELINAKLCNGRVRRDGKMAYSIDGLIIPEGEKRLLVSCSSEEDDISNLILILDRKLELNKYPLFFYYFSE